MANLNLITCEEFEPFREQLEILKAKVAELERRSDRWVDTKEALAETGIKSEQTLKKERDRQGSLLDFKIEGKRKILYSLNSIVAYNEAKALNRRKCSSS